MSEPHSKKLNSYSDVGDLRATLDSLVEAFENWRTISNDAADEMRYRRGVATNQTKEKTMQINVECQECEHDENETGVVSKWFDLDIDEVETPCGKEDHDLDGCLVVGVGDDDDFVTEYNIPVEEALEIHRAIDTIPSWIDNEVVKAYLENLHMTISEFTPSEFEEAFYGTYDSEAEFAQELASDVSQIDFNIWPASCIDWDHAAREIMHDHWSVKISTGVAIFNNC